MLDLDHISEAQIEKVVAIVDGEYHDLLADPANLGRNKQVSFRNDVDKVDQSSLLKLFWFVGLLLCYLFDLSLRDVLDDFYVDLPLRLTNQRKIDCF